MNRTMKVTFRMPNEKTESLMLSREAIASLVVGHTIETSGVVYEIVGVRLVLDDDQKEFKNNVDPPTAFEEGLVVTLDTVGRSTMPPPPSEPPR